MVHRKVAGGSFFLLMALSILSGRIFAAGTLASGTEVFHPEDYPPLRLPTPVDDGFSGGGGAGVGDFTDTTARLVTYVPGVGELGEGQGGGAAELVLEGDRTPSFQGAVALPAIDPAERSLSFSALERVGMTSTWPYSVCVKLFGRMPNGSGFSCSGTLVGPRHVLTAGHCVYSIENRAWASSITAVPGFASGAQPFGAARMTRLHAFREWIEQGDLRHDMALIELDRPIGALSGWLSVGFAESCDLFLSNAFDNPGYPAAAPFDGSDMFSWSGRLDRCTSRNLQVSFFQRSFGGQSGSGLFLRDDRTLYAVLSNGNNVRTNCPRVTETKFVKIRDDVLTAATPDAPDLTPLSVTSSAEVLRAGEAFTLTYLLHNGGSEPFQGNVAAAVYVSTDGEISASADERILDVEHEVEVDALGAVWLTTSELFLPADLGAGDYAVGLILEVDDARLENNRTLVDDVAPLTVLPPRAPSSWVTFDCDADGEMSISDAVCLLNVLFQSPEELPCSDAMDFNGDEALDVTDVVGALGHLFLRQAPAQRGVGCQVYSACSASQGCL